MHQVQTMPKTADSADSHQVNIEHDPRYTFFSIQ